MNPVEVMMHAVKHDGDTFYVRVLRHVDTGCPGLSVLGPTGSYLGMYTLTSGEWERLDEPLAGLVGGTVRSMLDGIWLALRREEW